MKLTLTSVKFGDTGIEDLPTWVDLRFTVDVPKGTALLGEITVGIDMTRLEFDSKTPKELSEMGLAKIRELLDIAI